MQYFWCASPLHLQCSYLIWFTSSSISPFLWIIIQDIESPRSLVTLDYQVLQALSLCRYFYYTYILWNFNLVLNQKSLDFKAFNQISNLTPSLVSSTRIISSAKSVHYGTSSWIYLVSLFISSGKIHALNVDHWCKTIVIGETHLWCLHLFSL